MLEYHFGRHETKILTNCALLLLCLIHPDSLCILISARGEVFFMADYAYILWYRYPN